MQILLITQIITQRPFVYGSGAVLITSNRQENRMNSKEYTGFDFLIHFSYPPG